jgi:hypothetical protein
VKFDGSGCAATIEMTMFSSTVVVMVVMMMMMRAGRTQILNPKRGTAVNVLYIAELICNSTQARDDVRGYECDMLRL